MELVLTGIIPKKHQEPHTQDPFIQKFDVISYESRSFIQVPVLQVSGEPQGYLFVVIPEHLKISKYLNNSRNHILEHSATRQKANLQSFRNVKIKKLNASAQRRVSIIKSVIHQPEILIMEEPDQNIDLESKVILKQQATRSSVRHCLYGESLYYSNE